MKVIDTLLKATKPYVATWDGAPSGVPYIGITGDIVKVMSVKHHTHYLVCCQQTQNVIWVSPLDFTEV